MTIAPLRMEIDGTITRYEVPKGGPGKISDWIRRYGWEPDTPLREGGITYPIWPKKHNMNKSSKKTPQNNKKIEFVRGQTLEEEMRTEGETTEEAETTVEDTGAIQRWHYYALGGGPDEEDQS